MKICTKCEVEKAESEFSKMKVGRDGLCAQCRSCCNEKNRKNYARDPERKLNLCRKWRKNNREAQLVINRRCAKKTRLSRLLSSSKGYAKAGDYVPCNATVEELKASITGRCFICGVPEIECSRRLVMDHNHETGEFRGWLCYKCNYALGGFNDSEELLIDALHYLMNCKVK